MMYISMELFALHNYCNVTTSFYTAYFLSPAKHCGNNHMIHSGNDHMIHCGNDHMIHSGNDHMIHSGNDHMIYIALV